MGVIAAIYYGIQGMKICGKLYEKCVILETQSVVLCNRIVHIGNRPVYFSCAVPFLNILPDDKATCGLDGDDTTYFFA